VYGLFHNWLTSLDNQKYIFIMNIWRF